MSELMANADEQGMNYTHWAYFPLAALSAAMECAEQLSEKFAAVVTVDLNYDGTEYLLRASRRMFFSTWEEGHAEIEAVVQEFGGTYDGGESGWLGGPAEE